MIYGIRLTHQVALSENESPKPAVRLTANIHGDETVGREMLIAFAERLCRDYGTPNADDVTWLLDNTVIYIIPSLNPDGFALGMRENSRGVDLNRDYPTRFEANQDDTAGRQAETAAMMDWTRARSFALSGTMHGGALVASYPWDSSVTGDDIYAATEDDAMYRRLARIYADANPSMAASPVFPNGITNGADWYSIVGTLQDYMVLRGTPSITFELSDNKSPPESALAGFWNDNRLALMQYAYQVHVSASGRVVDSSGQPIPGAACGIDSIEYGYKAPTNPHSGRFWRLVPEPGTYSVTCAAEGYTAVTKTVIVHEATIADPPTPTEQAHAFAQFVLPTAADAPAETTAGKIATDSTAGINIWMTLFLFVQISLIICAVVIYLNYRHKARHAGRF